METTMPNLEQAKQINRKYRDKIEAIKVRGISGDNVGVEMMNAFTQFQQELHETGYRFSDDANFSEDEDECLHLIPITEEWAEAQRQRKQRKQEAYDRFLSCLNEIPFDAEKVKASMHAFMNPNE
jgi:hypothetical protein